MTRALLVLALALAPAACLAFGPAQLFGDLENIDTPMPMKCSFNLTNKAGLKIGNLKGKWYFDTMIMGNGANASTFIKAFACAEASFMPMMVNKTHGLDVTAMLKPKTGKSGMLSTTYKKMPMEFTNITVKNNMVMNNTIRVPWTDYKTFLAVYTCNMPSGMDSVTLLSNNPHGMTKKQRMKVETALKKQKWSSMNATTYTPWKGCPMPPPHTTPSSSASKTVVASLLALVAVVPLSFKMAASL